MNPIIITDETPLKLLKIWLKERLDKGEKCPCCHQHAEMYYRPITSSMAYALILVYQAFTREYSSATINGWLHVETYLKNRDCPSSIRGDFSKFKHWGLIESKEGIAEDGNPNNGLYRLTQKGKDFVEGKISVESHVKIYNNKKFGFSDKLITIEKSLNKKFNYNELMK